MILSSQAGLLDLLTEAVGCGYLSNLHLTENRKQLIKILRAIPTEEYSEKEWEDAARYLLGNENLFTDAEEVRRVLIDRLSE